MGLKFRSTSTIQDNQPAEALAIVTECDKLLERLSMEPLVSASPA